MLAQATLRLAEFVTLPAIILQTLSRCEYVHICGAFHHQTFVFQNEPGSVACSSTLSQDVALAVMALSGLSIAINTMLGW